ncbi:hypothetical protein JHW43_000732 [Diplocarpon mali]|nr:hypothetical protein JHW43_000732 [Diplocarpon mali]
MKDRPGRIFDPAGARVVLDLVDDVRRLATEDYSIVVATRSYARHGVTVTSSYGVSFGFSKRDISKRIPLHTVTRTRESEIYAVIMGLKAVLDIIVSLDIRLAIIKVAQVYVLKMANEQAWELEENEKRDVEERTLVQEVHKACLELENKGVGVKFWLDERDSPMSNGAKWLAWSAVYNGT